MLSVIIMRFIHVKINGIFQNFYTILHEYICYYKNPSSFPMHFHLHLETRGVLFFILFQGCRLAAGFAAEVDAAANCHTAAWILFAE